MNIDELLERFRYRPDWLFRWTGREVQITMTVLNSDESGELIFTGAGRPLDPEIIKTEEDFLDWMWETIRRVEAHEQGEWFRFDGQQVRNPHDNLQKMYDEMVKE